MHLEEESFDVVVGIVQQDPDGGDPTRPLLVELPGHDRRLAEAGRSAEQHEADILRGIELRIDLGAFNQFHRRSRWGQSRRKGGGRTAGCRDIGHR